MLKCTFRTVDRKKKKKKTFQAELFAPDLFLKIILTLKK